MKIRSGWVSNSSTSSFVGIFAKIVDLDKAKEFVKTNSKCDFAIFSKKNLEKQLHDDEFWLGFGFCGNSIRPTAEYLNSTSDDSNFIALCHYVYEVDLPAVVPDIEKAYEEANKEIIDVSNTMEDNKAFTDLSIIGCWGWS